MNDGTPTFCECAEILTACTNQYVTGPEKTGLIYTKHTRSHFAAYLFFCVCYSISVSCIEFFRIVCIYDEMCVEILCCYNEIFHLKD